MLTVDKNANAQRAPGPNEQLLGDLDFCQFLRKPIGHAIRPLMFWGPKVHLLPAKPIDQLAGSVPSISLNQLLDKHKLSSARRRVLAYILARSVWQYYDSDWMRVKWTAESIHFMKEEPSNSKEQDKESDITAPYFALQVPTQQAYITDEHIRGDSFIHHYPRIITLGILMIEVCRGDSKAYPDSNAESIEMRMNNEYARYRKISMSRDWPYLDFKLHSSKEAYKKVVQRCFDLEIFKDALTIRERRAGVFKEVIYPLQKLFVDMKLLDGLGNVEPFGSEDEGAEIQVSGPPQCRQRATRGKRSSFPDSL